MNGTEVSAVMATLTAGIGTFTGLLPGIDKIRKATPADDSVKHDLRVAEVTATLIVLALGAAAAHFSKNRLPLVVAVIVAIGLIAMYESILTITPPERKNK